MDAAEEEAMPEEEVQEEEPRTKKDIDYLSDMSKAFEYDPEKHEEKMKTLSKQILKNKYDEEMKEFDEEKNEAITEE